MKKNQYPFCSIIILNYFGEKVIEATLNSVLNIKYPQKRYEIIVVDNNSKDRSKDILTRYASKFPNIKLFFLNKNLGFSKGNNVGLKKAKGEFVALLNNDCVVEKGWLAELVKTIKKDNRIFAVNSKILLYPKIINVRFTINNKLIPVYAWLSKSDLYDISEAKLYYPPMWRKLDYFEIEIPYEPYKDTRVELTLLVNMRGFRYENTSDLKNAVVFENKSIFTTDCKIDEDNAEYQIVLDLSKKSIQKQSLDKIQNAGIVVFQDGYGRDIGAIVSGNKQYHEYDSKQYNAEKEVYAACGAAVLYNRKVLKEIGYLDESFFMYYEDVDICERARFAGYKTIYSPRAVVRHYHALFSKEWSPFFIYHVEKGRLLHLFYNFPLEVFILAYYRMVVDSILTLFILIFQLRTFIYKLKTKKHESNEPIFIRRIQTIRALGFFIIYAPLLIIKRIKYNQKRNKEAMIQNYEKILRGDWYFS